MWKPAFLTVICAFAALFSWAQDTTATHVKPADTAHHDREVQNRLSRHRFWGNATTFGLGGCISRNNELSADAGRARITGSDLGIYARTTGLGYSAVFTGSKTNSYYRAYYELSGVALCLGVGLRVEAITNSSFDSYFIRPSAGLTFWTIGAWMFDMHYSYAFHISGPDRPFSHALTIRTKLLLNQKKWEYVHYPLM